jgi:hypothetical protein
MVRCQDASRLPRAATSSGGSDAKSQRSENSGRLPQLAPSLRLLTSRACDAVIIAYCRDRYCVLLTFVTGGGGLERLQAISATCHRTRRSRTTMLSSIAQRLFSFAFNSVVREPPPLVRNLQERCPFDSVIRRVGQINAELRIVPAFFWIGHERPTTTVHQRPPNSPVGPSTDTKSLI